MARFGEIINDVVGRVLEIPDDQQARGHEYLSVDCRLGGEWIAMPTNGPGALYNRQFGTVREPSPYPSWVWDAISRRWEAPIPRPGGKPNARWNEVQQKWDLDGFAVDRGTGLLSN